MVNPPDPRAVEVIEADARRYTEVRGGGRELNVTIDSFVRFLSRHLADAGLLVTDEWVHVSDAGYTAVDMFEAFYAGIRWLADRVEIVDGEIDMPSEDHPGVIGMDHGEACGSWLNDYDADTGRVNDDGEYRRPELVTDEMRAVIDAAVEFTRERDAITEADAPGVIPDYMPILEAVDTYLAAGDDQ